MNASNSSEPGAQTRSTARKCDAKPQASHSNDLAAFFQQRAEAGVSVIVSEQRQASGLHGIKHAVVLCAM